MAQDLLKNIIDDVKSTLTAGSPTVEFPIAYNRIDHWVRSARDQVVSEYLEGRAPHDNSVLSAYLVNLNTEALTPTSEALQGLTRYYMEITNGQFLMLGIAFDKQIVDAYWHRSAVSKHVRARVVSQQERNNINDMEFTSPTEDRPIIYGVNYWKATVPTLRVYIEGPGANTTSGKLELWGVLASLPYDADMKQTDQNEHFTIAPSHVLQVTELAIQKGARELNIPHLMNVVNEGIPINPNA